MKKKKKNIETIPVGPLGLIPLKSCAELGKKVDQYLVSWRKERDPEAGFSCCLYTKYYSGQKREVIEGVVFRIIMPLNDEYSFDYAQILSHSAASAGKVREVNWIRYIIPPRHTPLCKLSICLWL